VLEEIGDGSTADIVGHILKRFTSSQCSITSPFFSRVNTFGQFFALQDD